MSNFIDLSDNLYMKSTHNSSILAFFLVAAEMSKRPSFERSQVTLSLATPWGMLNVLVTCFNSVLRPVTLSCSCRPRELNLEKEKRPGRGSNRVFTRGWGLCSILFQPPPPHLVVIQKNYIFFLSSLTVGLKKIYESPSM